MGPQVYPQYLDVFHLVLPFVLPRQWSVLIDRMPHHSAHAAISPSVKHEHQIWLGSTNPRHKILQHVKVPCCTAHKKLFVNMRWDPLI